MITHNHPSFSSQDSAVQTPTAAKTANGNSELCIYACWPDVPMASSSRESILVELQRLRPSDASSVERVLDPVAWKKCLRKSMRIELQHILRGAAELVSQSTTGYMDPLALGERELVHGTTRLGGDAAAAGAGAMGMMPPSRSRNVLVVSPRNAVSRACILLYISSYIAGRRYPNSISLKFGLNYTCGVLRSFNYYYYYYYYYHYY